MLVTRGTRDMKESDVKEVEQLHAELAASETIIQSLVDDIAELKIENQRIKNQAGNGCDED